MNQIQQKNNMRVYVSVDDTDSRESRGTGFKSRQMASELVLAGHGRVLGVTRHQLWVDQRISYTSQNSSNCVEIDTPNPDKLWDFCQTFLLREAMPGSDAGLCLAEIDQIPDEIQDWGTRAKTEFLDQEEARQLALKHSLRLEGLTGDGSGVIGALAALGLRKSGNDGRFIWQPGKQLRDMQGTVTIEELLRGTQVEAVMTRDGSILEGSVLVDLTDWVRAILINGKAYLIAEQNPRKSGSNWIISDKLYLKSLSS